MGPNMGNKKLQVKKWHQMNLPVFFFVFSCGSRLPGENAKLLLKLRIPQCQELVVLIRTFAVRVSTAP